jgi:hypothetical protein
VARRDWGWEARIPLSSLVEIMITNLRYKDQYYPLSSPVIVIIVIIVLKPPIV